MTVVPSRAIPPPVGYELVFDRLSDSRKRGYAERSAVVAVMPKSVGAPLWTTRHRATTVPLAKRAWRAGSCSVLSSCKRRSLAAADAAHGVRPLLRAARRFRVPEQDRRRRSRAYSRCFRSGWRSHFGTANVAGP